jgi:hypothetical protein
MGRLNAEDKDIDVKNAIGHTLVVAPNNMYIQTLSKNMLSTHGSWESEGSER